MPSAADRLRSIDIYNPHNAMKVAVENGYDGEDILITYTAADNGRGGHGAFWRVSSLTRQTAPGGHWQDHGMKTIGLWGRGPHAEIKAAALAEAKAFASEKYGVTDWVPISGLRGALFPAAAAAVIKRLLREAQK